jgi:hypothetical protein
MYYGGHNDISARASHENAPHVTGPELLALLKRRSFCQMYRSHFLRKHSRIVNADVARQGDCHHILYF